MVICRIKGGIVLQKKILHYKLSSGLMIVGIIISFICFFNCMNLYHLLVMQSKEIDDYQYKERLSGTYQNMGEEVSFGDYFTADKGIIRIQEATLYRNFVSAPGLADVLLSQNEPLIYPVVEGKIPVTDKGINCPTVILGRGHLQGVSYKNNTMYYELEGVKCQVCAVIGSEGSDIFDYKIILYYNGLNDEMRRRIDILSDFSFVIESNKDEVQDIMGNIQNQVHNCTSNVAIGTGFSGLNENQVGIEEDTSYYLIIFLFCIVNVILVSEYWVKRRYKEIAIRKIFGYSDAQVFKALHRDMILNISIAVDIACIIQVVLKSIFKEYIRIYMSQMGFYIGYSIMFVYLLSLLLMIYPIILLRKQDVMKQMVSNCK